MGFLKEKYTTEYFTGLGPDGSKLDYGALGADEWRKGGIFHEIQDPIDLIDLNDKVVLEIGYGRAESARYMIAHKNISRYVGVDFSENAYSLALKTLSNSAPSKYELVIADAIEFMKTRKFIDKFDAVFMLDSIEHIPKPEVDELLPLIFRSLKVGGYLIVDTPFYSVDEDYLFQGHYIAPSPTDLHPATTGMHCNKYTRRRLIREVGSTGFRILSNKHFQKPEDKSKQIIVNLIKYNIRSIFNNIIYIIKKLCNN